MILMFSESSKFLKLFSAPIPYFHYVKMEKNPPSKNIPPPHLNFALICIMFLTIKSSSYILLKVAIILMLSHCRLNQYPQQGQAATEAVDENLSENDGEVEKKLKESELIIENKYKEMDNKLREEKGDIVLLANETHEEKHQAEQKMKEKVEDKEADLKKEKHEKEIKKVEDGKEGVLAKLDTQLKGILKTSENKPSLHDESGVKDSQTGVSKSDVKAGDVEKPSASNLNVASVKPGRTLPQVDKLETKGAGKPPLAVHSVSQGESPHKQQPQAGDGSVKPVSHSVKQLVKQFERDRSRERETLELPKAFSMPENISDNLKSSIPRRQSEPSCNIVDSSSQYPEHLVSRAQLTFAIMQNEDRTHTVGDDNVDENATRAAPFTHASQWQGISAFASSSEESEHEDAEEGIGGDGKIHKSSKTAKGNLMHTLADEDDLRLDSVARNSIVFYDGDKDSKAGLRNSLIFIDDDIEDSPHEQLGLLIKDRVDERSLNIDSKDFSFSVPGASEGRSRILSKTDKVNSESGAIVTNHHTSADSIVPSAFSSSNIVNDKLAKDIGNRISAPLKYPSSPSKSALKDKESLSDVKKLAVLNNLKLSGFGMKLSGTNLRKERSSDSLDKLLKDKQTENVNQSSPSKSRHMLKPLDFALREKNKSEGDLAGIERKARSRSRDEKERGRSGSLSEAKIKNRRQSLSTIEEHMNKVHASPTVTPVVEENPICNNDIVPSPRNRSVKNDKIHVVPSLSNTTISSEKIVPSASNSSVNNDKTMTSASNTSVKSNKASDEKVREKKESKRPSKRRSSSASRVEKREREMSKTLEPVQFTPVPPLELSSRVPKPPTAGSAPTRNLVYSSR